MNIRELANRLRKAANVLDNLLDADLGNRDEREAEARRNIIKKRNIPWQHRPENKKRAEAWKRKMSKVNRARHKNS